MRYFFVTFLLLLNFVVQAAETRYTISLKDWPQDVVARIYRVAPEITAKEHDAYSLNLILKKLDESFNFNSLRLVQTDNSTDLTLVGEISPEVRIQFNGLSEITEGEALNTMGLNLSNVLDEDNLKVGIEKLAGYYKELGYRFAQVRYVISSEATLVKTVTFTVTKKDQTYLRKIILEGMADTDLSKKIEVKLWRKFRKATLTQDTIAKISGDIRQHLSTNGFYLAQVPSPQIVFAADELSARIIYKIQPSQRYSIEVINTKQYPHDYLEDDILKLSTYYSKDGNLGSELAEQLKTFYFSEGYPHISVLFYETKIGDRIHLYLNVEEGPFTKIHDFKVIGQFSRPEKFYIDKFYELASAKVQDKYYLKDDIETAAKNLLIYLQNDGYVNAKLSRVFASTDREEPSHGVLVIQLEEGAQVKVSSIEFTGVSAANLEGVKFAAGIINNQSLSLAKLEASIANVKSFYQNEGYIEYKLLNETTDLITYTDNNSRAALKFVVQEGPKVTAQSIDIEGNTRTQNKLILLELDFKPGDVITPAKIDESILRLQRTGYFNSVEISTLEKDTPVATRTVVIKVVERDPGLFVTGVGITDENRGTLHGYIGAAYRNFWGRGVGLSLRSEANYNFASIKYLEHKHTLGLVWPYIFDTRARFRTSATRSTTIADIRINKVTEANTALFSIEQDFSTHFTGMLSYGVTTFFDHGIDNSDEIQYGYSSESMVIGSFGPAIELDYRDNIFNPTRGSFSRVALEYSAEGLGNNNIDDFYRVSAQTTFYFPYKDTGVVFVQALRGGYIEDIDTQGEGIPFDKKGFSLGGRTTIRGFESSEFFPTTQEVGASYRLLTSSQFQLVKSELRFPISVKYDLAGALFYDGGQVTIKGLTLIDNWRDAVGFGLRYNTPVGPLSLDFAFKLDKKPNESDGAFHLSFGVF